MSIYASESVADAPGGGIAAAQLVSHLVLAVAVVFAAHRRQATISGAGLALLVCSLNYHLCRAALACFAGLSLDDWRRCDHFTALLLGANLGLALIQYGPLRLTDTFAQSLTAPVVFFAVQAYPFETQSALLVLVYVGLVAIDRFLRNGHDLTPPDPRNYKTRSLIVGGVLLLAGLCCYAFDSGDARGAALLDGVFHVAWHALVGSAIIAIVDGLQPVHSKGLFERRDNTV